MSLEEVGDAVLMSWRFLRMELIAVPLELMNEAKTSVLKRQIGITIE